MRSLLLASLLLLACRRPCPPPSDRVCGTIICKVSSYTGARYVCLDVDGEIIHVWTHADEHDALRVGAWHCGEPGVYPP